MPSCMVFARDNAILKPSLESGMELRTLRRRGLVVQAYRFVESSGESVCRRPTRQPRVIPVR